MLQMPPGGANSRGGGGGGCSSRLICLKNMSFLDSNENKYRLSTSRVLKEYQNQFSCVCLWYTGGGVTCHYLGYGRAARFPGPSPIHMLGEVKNIPIHILPIAKIVPIHLLFFEILPIHILFGWKRYSNDILLKLTRYPFIYLEAWKVYPIPAALLYYIYIYKGICIKIGKLSISLTWKHLVLCSLTKGSRYLDRDL